MLTLNKAIFQDAITDKTYAFDDVRNLAESFGEGLRFQFDWQKGDVLAVSSLNNIDMPPIIFGALWAGGTVTTSNPAYTVTELTHQLRDSAAKCIVTQYSNIKTVRQACRLVGIPEDRIIILGDQKDSTGHFKHWTTVRNVSSAKRFRACKIDPENDTAFLVYSSGTTGKPKGVMLSHYNITSNVTQLQQAEGFNLTWNGSKSTSDIPLPFSKGGGDKILACLPFFHIYGLTVLVHSPIYAGVTTIVQPRFDIEKWCQLVQKHKITFSYIVPPIVLHLAKHPSVGSYDLSSLRMTQSGAAPLTRELIETVYTRLGIRIKQGYGLSETSPCVYQGTWDSWNVDIGSCGTLLPNMQAKICLPVDESSITTETSTKDLEVGEIGELHVRGPNVFKGYHNNHSATAGCLSQDGWFRTGDVGYINDRGNLFITDRVKELIKYKGFQVAPAELEGYLINFPGIMDCAVVGVSHKELATEVPRAYLVPKDPSKMVDVESLTKWFNERVAHHKRLRGGIRFVKEIPKNASGKILRRALREEAKIEFDLEQCQLRGAKL